MGLLFGNNARLIQVSLLSPPPTHALTRSAGHPSQSQSTAGEVSIREHVRQTEILVISQRMQIQEITNVDILHTERIRFASVTFMADIIFVNLHMVQQQQQQQQWGQIKKKTNIYIYINYSRKSAKKTSSLTFIR